MHLIKMPGLISTSVQDNRNSLRLVVKYRVPKIIMDHFICYAGKSVNDHTSAILSVSVR